MAYTHNASTLPQRNNCSPPPHPFHLQSNKLFNWINPSLPTPSTTLSTHQKPFNCSSSHLTGSTVIPTLLPRRQPVTTNAREYSLTQLLQATKIYWRRINITLQPSIYLLSLHNKNNNHHHTNTQAHTKSTQTLSIPCLKGTTPPHPFVHAVMNYLTGLMPTPPTPLSTLLLLPPMQAHFHKHNCSRCQAFIKSLQKTILLRSHTKPPKVGAFSTSSN